MSCEQITRRRLLQTGGCALVSLTSLGFAPGVAVPVVAAAGSGTGKERTYPIPSADGVTIDRRAQVILVRVSGKVAAMSLACPHESAVVKWLPKDGRFQCSKHDSQYTPNGTYTSGHATRNLDRFPIRREGDSVVVSLDRVFHSDQNAQAWAAAAVDL
jgi:Rieske Fe-S protein